MSRIKAPEGYIYSLYAEKIDDPKMCQGSLSYIKHSEREIKEYREWHNLPEETWTITVELIADKVIE